MRSRSRYILAIYLSCAIAISGNTRAHDYTYGNSEHSKKYSSKRDQVPVNNVEITEDAAATTKSADYYGSKDIPAKSCRDIFLTNRAATSGNYWIKTQDGELLMVTCGFPTHKLNDEKAEVEKNETTGYRETKEVDSSSQQLKANESTVNSEKTSANATVHPEPEAVESSKGQLFLRNPSPNTRPTGPSNSMRKDNPHDLITIPTKRPRSTRTTKRAVKTTQSYVTLIPKPVSKRTTPKLVTKKTQSTIPTKKLKTSTKRISTKKQHKVTMLPFSTAKPNDDSLEGHENIRTTPAPHHKTTKNNPTSATTLLPLQTKTKVKRIKPKNVVITTDKPIVMTTKTTTVITQKHINPAKPTTKPLTLTTKTTKPFNPTTLFKRTTAVKPLDGSNLKNSNQTNSSLAEPVIKATPPTQAFSAPDTPSPFLDLLPASSFPRNISLFDSSTALNTNKLLANEVERIQSLQKAIADNVTAEELKLAVAKGLNKTTESLNALASDWLNASSIVTANNKPKKFMKLFKGNAGDLGDIQEEFPPQDIGGIYGKNSLAFAKQTPEQAMKSDYKEAQTFETNPEVRSWALREHKMNENNIFKSQYKHFDEEKLKPKNPTEEKANTRSWFEKQSQQASDRIKGQYDEFEKNEHDIVSDKYMQQYREFQQIQNANKNETDKDTDNQHDNKPTEKVSPPKSLSWDFKVSELRQHNISEEEMKEFIIREKYKEMMLREKPWNDLQKKYSKSAENVPNVEVIKRPTIQMTNNENKTSKSNEGNNTERSSFSEELRRLERIKEIGIHNTSENKTEDDYHSYVQNIADSDKEQIEQMQLNRFTHDYPGNNPKEGASLVKDLLKENSIQLVSQESDIQRASKREKGDKMKGENVVLDSENDAVLNMFFKNSTKESQLDDYLSGDKKYELLNNNKRKLKQISGPPNPIVEKDLTRREPKLKFLGIMNDEDRGTNLMMEEESEGEKRKATDEKLKLYLKLHGNDVTEERKPSNIYVDNRVFIYGNVNKALKQQLPSVLNTVIKKDKEGEEKIERHLRLQGLDQTDIETDIKSKPKSQITSKDVVMSFEPVGSSSKHLRQITENEERHLELNNFIRGSNVTVMNHFEKGKDSDKDGPKVNNITLSNKKKMKKESILGSQGVPLHEKETDREEIKKENKLKTSQYANVDGRTNIGSFSTSKLKLFSYKEGKPEGEGLLDSYGFIRDGRGEAHRLKHVEKSPETGDVRNTHIDKLAKTTSLKLKAYTEQKNISTDIFSKEVLPVKSLGFTESDDSGAGELGEEQQPFDHALVHVTDLLAKQLAKKHKHISPINQEQLPGAGDITINNDPLRNLSNSMSDIFNQVQAGMGNIPGFNEEARNTEEQARKNRKTKNNQQHKPVTGSIRQKIEQPHGNLNSESLPLMDKRWNIQKPPLQKRQKKSTVLTDNLEYNKQRVALEVGNVDSVERVENEKLNIIFNVRRRTDNATHKRVTRENLENKTNYNTKTPFLLPNNSKNNINYLKQNKSKIRLSPFMKMYRFIIGNNKELLGSSFPEAQPVSRFKDTDNKEHSNNFISRARKFKNYILKAKIRRRRETKIDLNILTGLVRALIPSRIGHLQPSNLKPMPPIGHDPEDATVSAPSNPTPELEGSKYENEGEGTSEQTYKPNAKKPKASENKNKQMYDTTFEAGLKEMEKSEEQLKKNKNQESKANTDGAVDLGTQRNEKMKSDEDAAYGNITIFNYPINVTALEQGIIQIINTTSTKQHIDNEKARKPDEKFPQLMLPQNHGEYTPPQEKPDDLADKPLEKQKGVAKKPKPLVNQTNREWSAKPLEGQTETEEANQTLKLVDTKSPNVTKMKEIKQAAPQKGITEAGKLMSEKSKEEDEYANIVDTTPTESPAAPIHFPNPTTTTTPTTTTSSTTTTTTSIPAIATEKQPPVLENDTVSSLVAKPLEKPITTINISQVMSLAAGEQFQPKEIANLTIMQEQGNLTLTSSSDLAAIPSKEFNNTVIIQQIPIANPLINQQHINNTLQEQTEKLIMEQPDQFHPSANESLEVLYSKENTTKVLENLPIINSTLFEGVDNTLKVTKGNSSSSNSTKGQGVTVTSDLNKTTSINKTQNTNSTVDLKNTTLTSNKTVLKNNTEVKITHLVDKNTTNDKSANHTINSEYQPTELSNAGIMPFPTEGNSAIPLIPIPADSPLGQLLYPALQSKGVIKNMFGQSNTSELASWGLVGGSGLVMDQTKKMFNKQKLSRDELVKLLQASYEQKFFKPVPPTLLNKALTIPDKRASVTANDTSIGTTSISPSSNGITIDIPVYKAQEDASLTSRETDSQSSASTIHIALENKNGHLVMVPGSSGSAQKRLLPQNIKLDLHYKITSQSQKKSYVNKLKSVTALSACKGNQKCARKRKLKRHKHHLQKKQKLSKYTVLPQYEFLDLVLQKQ